MVEVGTALALLGADMFAAAARSAGHRWGALPFGMAWTPAEPPRLLSDLTVLGLGLGLGRMSPSRGELRRAYWLAARAARPDVPGGSREAFLAVAGAFERLCAGSAGRRPGRAQDR